MKDRASTEFHLSPGPTGEVDAKEAFGKVLTGGSAVLLDRAMQLLSGLIASDEGFRAGGDVDPISVKVLSASRSIRVELRDEGSGVVLGGLRRHQGSGSLGQGSGSLGQGSGSLGWSPHLLSRIADRWGLVSGADGAWVWFELDRPQ
jgi:hypothetical protein